MIEYCTAIDNISVVKRLAFLAELLQKPRMKCFLNYAKKQVNPRYVLIDPFGAWNNSLAHQIPKNQLPKYEIVKKELVELLNQLFN